MATKRKSLSITEQKQLAALAARPDAPLAMHLRVWLLNKLTENREWLWAQLQEQIEHGNKETEARGRMLLSLIDRILPTQREVIQAPQNQAPTQANVAIKIVGVNRGTVQARKEAIEVQAQKRVAPLIAASGG